MPIRKINNNHIPSYTPNTALHKPGIIDKIYTFLSGLFSSFFSNKSLEENPFRFKGYVPLEKALNQKNPTVISATEQAQDQQNPRSPIEKKTCGLISRLFSFLIGNKK